MVQIVCPAFYNRYIDLVKSYKNADDALYEQSKRLLGFFIDDTENWANYSYAEGKWNIKQVWQHIIDTERIFSYRALCIARNDKTNLPAFDENDYAEHAFTGHRAITDLYKEFKAVRAATIYMVQGFTEGQFLRKGNVNGNEINVNALLYAIVGHTEHHLNIIDDRYRSKN